MLNIFRRIRRKLANENRFLQYSRYAIGEILLVVVGILIALQVNNWNEQQKENKLENEYYCRLLEDVRNDFEQVNALKDASKIRLKASNQAVRLLQKDKPNKIAVGYEISQSIKAIYADFRPNNAAFEDIKSGANLSIIKDKSIVKALNYYFNKMEGYISIININAENAVSIYFKHDDFFANGVVQASMTLGRYIEGMEKDVYDAIVVDVEETLSEEMRYRLYNEALRYISINSRHIELYDFILGEIEQLTTLLESKCISEKD